MAAEKYPSAWWGGVSPIPLFGLDTCRRSSGAIGLSAGGGRLRGNPPGILRRRARSSRRTPSRKLDTYGEPSEVCAESQAGPLLTRLKRSVPWSGGRVRARYPIQVLLLHQVFGYHKEQDKYFTPKTLFSHDLYTILCSSSRCKSWAVHHTLHPVHMYVGGCSRPPISPLHLPLHRISTSKCLPRPKAHSHSLSHQTKWFNRSVRFQSSRHYAVPHPRGHRLNSG